MTVIEICVEDVAGARTAQRAGADRIELCADLAHGGITPSIGLVATTLAALSRVGVQVLIRPRAGDFVYDRDDVEVMRADINAVRALAGRVTVPVGFVIGALTRAGEIDRDVVRVLQAAGGGAPITFHKAFDAVADHGRALDVLIALGVERVLTSAGAPSAAEGAVRLARLVRQGSGRIVVLAGGGVRSGNVVELVRATGVAEVHLRAPDQVRAPESEGRTSRTSPEEVAAVVAAVGSRRSLP